MKTTRRFQFRLYSLLKLITVITGLLALWKNCESIWRTDGEFELALAVLCSFLAILFSVPCLALPTIRRAIIPVFLVAVFLFSCRQFAAESWLRSVETEVLLMAEFADAHRRSTGKYPTSDSEYVYSDPDCIGLLKYWPINDGEYYIVSYDVVVGDSVNREYSPRGWYYYPD